MEKKNNSLRVRSLSVLWALLAILLWAAPCSGRTVASDDILNLGTDYPEARIEDDWLYVLGTVNLYPGAIVDYGIYVFPGEGVDEPGGTVNVYGCGPWNSLWVMESSSGWQGLPPVVTVYGPRFQIETSTGTGEPFAPPADKRFTGTLNVLSDSDQVLFSLYIASDIVAIHLRAPEAPAGLEGQLCIHPPVIHHQSRMRNRMPNRPHKMPRLVALLRLPEGVTKDDVDSDKPLVLYAGGDEVGIEASRQRIIQRCRRRPSRVSILAFFDKAELMEAAPDNGEVELKVVGQLKTGQYFYGTDTIRIITRRWRPRRRNCNRDD